MRVLRGDLIQLAKDGAFDVIIHGCNCMCTMGAGIAKTIREEFPEVYDADLATTKGDRGKLGTISAAEIVRGNPRFWVVNAYTQYHWRGKAVLVEYDAVRAAMCEVKQRFAGSRIGYPKIGAGLARGGWGRIADIIDEALAGEDHTLVEYEQSSGQASSRSPKEG